MKLFDSLRKNLREKSLDKKLTKANSDSEILKVANHELERQLSTDCPMATMGKKMMQELDITIEEVRILMLFDMLKKVFQFDSSTSEGVNLIKAICVDICHLNLPEDRIKKLYFISQNLSFSIKK